MTKKKVAKKTTRKTSKKATRKTTKKAAPKNTGMVETNDPTSVEFEYGAGDPIDGNDDSFVDNSDDSDDDSFVDNSDDSDDDSDDDSEDPGVHLDNCPDVNLDDYSVFTVRGLYIHGKGMKGGNEQDAYEEVFCLKTEAVPDNCRTRDEANQWIIGTSRSKIKKYLITPKLRDTKPHFKKVRTMSVIDYRPATAKDVEDMFLNPESIMKMSFTELAVFACQENLDVNMKYYANIAEARLKVLEVIESGKKNRRKYEVSSRKPINGEVDKNNKPM